ncbi:endonuclease IV [Gordoniibacillus kamchatkensis]|uniref:Endonuclease IV n=1 Tax=Gordoniibacillus kamchatkensis TaxID=1590651 RepID=A0ABR5AGN0_9BACL|nr:endonuclease IV [Paenibacillus sp. VKM B-2647]
MAARSIGSHVSIRRGYAAAAKTALSIGGSAFQYFPKNPRSLELKMPYDRSDAAACAAFCREHGLPSIGHAPYPVNLAIDDQAKREAIRRALLNALDITDACGSIGLVVHFGKFSGPDPLQGYKNIIQLMNSVLTEYEGKALFLLENMAGEGSQIGTTFEELVHMRQLCAYPHKVGFCVDTCHLFASGYWNGGNWPEVERRGLELGFFEHVRAVHFNDSVYGSGERKDRHARIGHGRIGLPALRAALQSPALARVPFVLETEPGADGTHRDEIAFVRELAAGR